MLSLHWLRCKVLNMILGGGILRSGGKTNYIPVVYFMLSLEEGGKISDFISGISKKKVDAEPILYNFMKIL